MLTATVLAIFFVPMFFVLVRRLFGQHGSAATTDDRRRIAPRDRAPQGA